MSALKTIAKRILPPRLVARISSQRWRKYNRETYAKSGILDICRQFVLRYGTTVLYGPFKGLKYSTESALSHYSTAALLGTYERELHPWLERLRPNTFERILDIGAAEGYYAVGLAMRTNTPVDAYETEPNSRRSCQQLAKLNGVAHLVSVHSWCSHKQLQRLAGKRCFIVSDCEGYEVPLFSPQVVEALAMCDLIIELHDEPARNESTRAILEDRFAVSHHLEIVKFKPRDWSASPELSFLSFLGKDANRAISEEGRESDQEWLIATSIAGLRECEHKRPLVEQGNNSNPLTGRTPSLQA
jgi:hypothetical protein